MLNFHGVLIMDCISTNFWGGSQYSFFKTLLRLLMKYYLPLLLSGGHTPKWYPDILKICHQKPMALYFCSPLGRGEMRISFHSRRVAMGESPSIVRHLHVTRFGQKSCRGNDAWIFGTISTRMGNKTPIWVKECIRRIRFYNKSIQGGPLLTSTSCILEL